MKKLKPPQIIALSFLLAILVGTILLSLPFSTTNEDKIGFIDRLFTATSATCVTGLVVKDTSSWAPFGRIVILGLFQAGGLGIMTFSTLFAILLGRKLSIRDGVVIQGALNQPNAQNIKKLLLYIVCITLGIEAIGAGLLYSRWMHLGNWDSFTTLSNAVFHSISAFCNAGFSLFQKSFTGFQSDVFINIIMISLIFIGGIGFIVLLDVSKLKFWRHNHRIIFSKITLQTKIALSVSIALILIGALVIFLLEKENVLQGLSLKEKLLGSFFQAVTPRTAGFNTLPIGNFTAPTLIFIIFLMFIGASPGSTGGGIKTCTFGILLATIFSMLRNRNRVWAFKKTIPRDVVRKALVVFMLALAWIFLFSLILSFTERSSMGPDRFFLKMLFEVTSAFGTVGLSTGITPLLSNLGKVLMILTMFAGRIGPLTLALAIAMHEEKTLYNYPEEKVMVG